MKVQILTSLILIAIIGPPLFSCSNDHQAEESIYQKYEDYELVWHDEFEEDGRPSADNWGYEHGFVRNKELQWYQPENAIIKDGMLIIEGRRERVENSDYNSTSNDWRKNRPYAEFTSASLNTEGKHAFKYGIFEVRAKIDTAKGLWPAIWTVGEAPGRQWPAIGEVDMMEHYPVDGEPALLANAAWEGDKNQSEWDDVKVPLKHFLKQDSSWVEKFHVWKMKWTREKIALYLDDELLNVIGLDKTQNPDDFNPFHHPHIIRINLAIGSTGGDPSQTIFPRQYKVDYVRVYQKKQ